MTVTLDALADLFRQELTAYRDGRYKPAHERKKELNAAVKRLVEAAQDYADTMPATPAERRAVLDAGLAGAARRAALETTLSDRKART